MNLRFESSIISYGSKTSTVVTLKDSSFESSVISYGSKTEHQANVLDMTFESSVISYGSKTYRNTGDWNTGLRVV